MARKVDSRRGRRRASAIQRACFAAIALSFTATARAQPAAPQISNGTAAAVCAFPSVICLGTTGCKCTATLVHPSLVLYAAHCGSATAFTFGEKRNGPVLQVSKWNRNPDWGKKPNPNDDVDLDWAYAVLTAPVTDVPITPVAYGCELDQVVRVGQPIYQIGFGAPNSGTKFWKTNTIRLLADGVITTGMGGVACPGDSGGPLLVRLDDQSWRTIGTASTIVPDDITPQCGNAGTWNDYSRVRRAMIDWVETDSGIDITPCHDRDGTWNPSPACGGFFAGGTDGVGTWMNSCQGTPVVAKSATCAGGVILDAGVDVGPGSAGTGGRDGGSDGSANGGSAGQDGDAGGSGASGEAGIVATGGAAGVSTSTSSTGAGTGGTPGAGGSGPGAGGASSMGASTSDEASCSCRSTRPGPVVPKAFFVAALSLTFAKRRRLRLRGRSTGR